VGLSELIAHIQVFPEQNVTLESVVLQLLVAAARQHPGLSKEELSGNILGRDRNTLAAVGEGLAIPHAYVEGFTNSHCYLGIVTHGVTDVASPDHETVRMVCLLLSPANHPGKHLESLAILSGLSHARDLFRV